MHLIPSRNAQSAMAPFLQMMHTSAEQEGDMLILNEPVLFTFEKPRERLVFYPGYARNPASELGQACQSLAQTEGAIEDAAKAVVNGAGHFLFSTPHLVVRADVDSSGRFNMQTIVSETNPFVGALGQLALQMSILQELMAGAVKKPVGTLSFQHMNVILKDEVITHLLKLGYEEPVRDPYAEGMKVRRIDGPLQLKMLSEEGNNATGYKSKWVRHVALPLLACINTETAEEARELVKTIKAEDWRRAMSQWIEAVIMQQRYQQEQEDGQEKA
ncbi:MAG: hypothetical protein GY906_03765 [bacterium]|nr:hypothetical protein [bacterium]